MFMSTWSHQHVSGEMQTSADGFCSAVCRKFQNEVSIQAPAPASMDAAAAAAEETTVAVRKCRVSVLTRRCSVCSCVDIRVVV